MENEKKAIIYCRVSSREQSENYSLANQKEACHKFAYNNGYRIVRGFVNEKGESAKTANRPVLQQMLKHIAKEKGNIDALIIWKYDRLARDMADYTELLHFFGISGIKVISVTEQTDDSSSGKLMRNIFGSFAQFENDVKSERTIAGMKQAVEQGRWVWKAPLGYKFTKDSLGKSILVPDNMAPFIKDAFKMAARGIYKQAEIISRLRQNGYSVSQQHLHRILRNPVYAGLIVKKDWFSEPIKALHQSLISEDLFEQVQLILNGKRPNSKPYTRNNPEFPLRIFLRCGLCGEKITGSFSTGRGRNRYPYYHCRKSGCGFGSVKRDALHQDFLDRLKSISPAKETVKLFEEIIKDVWRSKHKALIETNKKLKSEIRKLQIKKDRANELLLEGTLNKDDYLEIVDGIKEKICNLKLDINNSQMELSDIDNCINYCSRFLLELPEMWKMADIDLKQRFQTFIFPQGIEYYKGKFGTAQTAIIFNVLGNESTAYKTMASPRGFEPLLPP